MNENQSMWEELKAIPHWSMITDANGVRILKSRNDPHLVEYLTESGQPVMKLLPSLVRPITWVRLSEEGRS